MTGSFVLGTLRRAACSVAFASAVAAQRPATTPKPLDRTVTPVAGKTPQLRVPGWTRTRLANGAQLIVSERHNLPLVSVTVSIAGGTNQYEPTDKTGVGQLVAVMLTEGTTTKTGDEISNAMQLLGTSINTSIERESGTIGFVAMKDKFDPALTLLADLVVNPIFPAEAFARRQASMLVDLEQAKDVTSSIASVVFRKTVFTSAHPYGRTANEETVKRITRNDLVAFHRQFFQPSHAIITVVGDLRGEEVKRIAERVFASWKGMTTTPVSFSYPAVAAPKTTTIYLVDKPDAAQSSFAIGGIGPARDTPDYFALAVMNMLFGELFQSRLNANIREQKGYSYGVGSRFYFGRGPGPFRASGDIVTAKTDSALIEFMKEIRGIRGERPLTDDEMEAAKNALVQSLPGRFTSMNGIGTSIDSIYSAGLPEDYYQRYAKSVEAVTKDDVVRVARKYIDPDHLSIVIVGDRKEIERPLEQLKLAPIIRLDLLGNPMRDPVRP